MSDQTPSPDDALDELLSAVLDGEADPTERARVDADPDLQERLRELRAVRDLVAQPIGPLDELTARRLRERAIAEGLAGAPALAGPAGAAAATAAGARSTTTPPAAPRRPWQDARWLGAVAAVLVLVALAVPLARTLGSDDDADQLASTSAGDDADESVEALTDDSTSAEAADAGGGDEGGDDSSGATALYDMSDLGDVTSDDELAERALEEYGAAATEREATGANAVQDALAEEPTTWCDPEVDESLVVVVTLVGHVEGEARIVQVLGDPDGRTSVVVVDPSTCTVILTRR